MQNKKNFLEIVIPNKGSAPEIYHNGEKVVGLDANKKTINNIAVEQLTFNYLTNTDTEHQSTLSFSGYQQPYGGIDGFAPFYIPQVIFGLNDIDKALAKCKKDYNFSKEKYFANEAKAKAKQTSKK